MPNNREQQLMEAKADMVLQLKAWCERHNLTASEVLALLAFMTGAAIAHQDQRKMTPANAMEVVSANIEAGNAAAIASVAAACGRAN